MESHAVHPYLSGHAADSLAEKWRVHQVSTMNCASPTAGEKHIRNPVADRYRTDVVHCTTLSLSRKYLPSASVSYTTHTRLPPAFVWRDRCVFSYVALQLSLLPTTTVCFYWRPLETT